MKLLIVAGGGGHFAPALAVIEALPRDIKVLVVGRKFTFEGDSTESLEYQTARKLNIPFKTITTGRLQRRITKHTLGSLLKVPLGYVQSLKIVKEFDPDVVLSFGGYVSLPVAFAAKTLGISIVVHEQVLGAGLANKIVAKFAQKVCVSWEESASFFPKEKVIVTGNPIRQVHTSQSIVHSFDKKSPVIYVTGGSGGAHGINLLIEDCLPQLLEKYTVIHQTGDAQEFGDFARLEKKRDSLTNELKKRYIVTKFVDPKEVVPLMQQADLVIARSGMNTMTELLSLGKPCLLIPLPYGQRNEQLTNARFVEKAGIAEVADQRDLTGEKLIDLLSSMMSKLSMYQKAGEAAKKMIIKESAQKIISVIKDVNKQT